MSDYSPPTMTYDANADNNIIYVHMYDFSGNDNDGYFSISTLNTWRPVAFVGRPRMPWTRCATQAGPGSVYIPRH